jgi:transcriptional regulator with XRE-family HTH domain
LRREELAALAGISADYLTRLEQGRATAPSTQVAESLARALRLSDPERDLLYRLAGHAAPGPDVVQSRVTPSVQRLLDRLSHTPVVVYDASWTLVLANTPYDALMGDTTTWRGLERNAVWRNVTRLPSRVVHTPREHAEHEARLVSDLRLTASRYPADPALRRLVVDLATGDSPNSGTPTPRRPWPTRRGARPSTTRWSARSPSTATRCSSPSTTCASASTPPSPAPRTPTAWPSPPCSAPSRYSSEHDVRKCPLTRRRASVWVFAQRPLMPLIERFSDGQDRV